MRRAGAIACGALLLAGTLVAWLGVHREARPVPAPPAPVFQIPGAVRGHAVPPPPLASPVLAEVRDALARSYYRFVPEDVLSLPSVALILDALDDPYTEYLDPAEYEVLKDQLSRNYFGVGLTVGPGDGGLIVTSSLDGPAREAGIKAGDVIVSIDGQLATKLPFDRSAALIKGEKGTVVHLTVRRPGRQRAFRFAVLRTEIAYPSVRFRAIRTHGERLGYIRVLSFRDDVASRVSAAIRKLDGSRARGFILDLRGDPGGLLTQAIAVTSLFVKEGMVCSTSSLHTTRSYYVRGDAIDTKSRLVVLVDGGTASAAEIVAAALADNGRATLVGARTYGKATVQTLVDLSNGGALKLTTATYLTPSGTSIRAKGIRPKVKARDDPLTRPDEAVVIAEKTLLRKS